MKHQPTRAELQKRVRELEETLEWQRMELERLRRSEELYRDVIEGTDDLVTRVDGDGRLEYVNRAGENIFGCQLKQCIGKQAFDYIHPEDREAARASFDGWIADRFTNVTFENRLVNQVTGQVFEMLCTVNLRYDENGKLLGINSIARDLTDRKRYEKELKSLTRTLRERVKELNCLYKISRLREDHKFSLDQFIQAIVDIIPEGMQYPEIACAQVEFEGYAYQTANFKRTPWRLGRDVRVHNEVVCKLEVGYVTEKGDWGEAPFLEEEEEMIDAVAGRIGNIIEREWAEIEIRNHREQLAELLSVQTEVLERTELQLQKEIQRRQRAEESLLDAESE